VSSAPPAKDTWISPLRHQRAESMTGALLPHLRSDADIPHQVLDVAGGIDDPRIIEALRRLLHQPNQGVDLKNAQLAYRPTIRAAKALAESPCLSAIPALVESYAGNDATIRLRILCGILLTTDEGGQYREPEVNWDDRLRDLILAGITDGDSRVRQVAAMCLGMKQVADSEKDLLKMTYADDSSERAAALVGLRWKNMSQEVQARIVALLKDPDREVCQQAVYATIMLDDPSSVTGHLLDLLSSPSEHLREIVCSRLGHKSHRLDPRVLPAMIEMMGDSSNYVARRAEATAWFAATSPEQKALVEAVSAKLERRAPGPGIP
jgi:HEAT repeat protein